MQKFGLVTSSHEFIRKYVFGTGCLKFSHNLGQALNDLYFILYAFRTFLQRLNRYVAYLSEI